jgi:cobaltochelatase CobS
LEVGFISLSQGVTESHLVGRILPAADGSWSYRPSRFVEIYEQGGVYLLDEIDAADANLMVSINAALANGTLANPNGGIHRRHERTIIVAAANTWGRGADACYVGRNALDASTLDRFVLSTAFIEYDAELESQIAAEAGSEGAKLLKWVTQLRESIQSHRIRRIASTRLVAGGAAALRAGRTLDEIKSRFLAGWSAEEVSKVGGRA